MSITETSLTISMSKWLEGDREIYMISVEDEGTDHVAALLKITLDQLESILSGKPTTIDHCVVSKMVESQ